jgi:hypothetical protein
MMAAASCGPTAWLTACLISLSVSRLAIAASSYVSAGELLPVVWILQRLDAAGKLRLTDAVEAATL